MKPWKKHAEHKSSLTDKWLYIRAKFYMLNTMSACSRVCGCVCVIGLLILIEHAKPSLG